MMKHLEWVEPSQNIKRRGWKSRLSVRQKEKSEKRMRICWLSMILWRTCGWLKCAVPCRYSEYIIIIFWVTGIRVCRVALRTTTRKRSFKHHLKKQEGKLLSIYARSDPMWCSLLIRWVGMGILITFMPIDRL